MRPRQQRMLAVGLVVAGVGIAAFFALQAFQENLLYYYSPTQIADGEAPAGRAIRVGGLVVDGSLSREEGTLNVEFVVTDLASEVRIKHTGILPDLFREGQGVIARGQFNSNGMFVADEVLAKHDENYMPPEVAESLKEMHQGAEGS